MRKLLVLSLCMLLFACASTSTQEEVASTDILSDTETILISNTELHPFSDPIKQDTFRIKLVGDSLHIAIATLEIVGHDGRILYTESFTANYLLNYDTPLNPTPGQRDEFILNRIDTFFDAENFKMPAITADMTFDPNYSDQQIWDDIKSDDASIGFHYLLGKEDGRWLAYSKSQQEVVLYFNCC